MLPHVLAGAEAVPPPLPLLTHKTKASLGGPASGRFVLNARAFRVQRHFDFHPSLRKMDGEVREKISWVRLTARIPLAWRDLHPRLEADWLFDRAHRSWQYLAEAASAFSSAGHSRGRYRRLFPSPIYVSARMALGLDRRTEAHLMDRVGVLGETYNPCRLFQALLASSSKPSAALVRHKIDRTPDQEQDSNSQTDADFVE